MAAEDESTVQGGPSAEDAAEKEVREAADRLREIKVADLIVQATAGLVSLGFVRLAGDQRDLAQTQLAIDSLRALEPVVRAQISAEVASELQNALASLQLAFAEAVGAGKAPEEPAAPEPEQAESPAGEPESSD